MSIDATVGGVNANSYVSLTYANSFFEAMLKTSVWDNAVPDDQERALMTATQWLEEYDYIGRAATLTQALKWPRFGLSDVLSGTEQLILGLYDETEMPVPLLNATCELAFYLLSLGDAGGAAAITTGLGQPSSLKLGNEVEVKYQQQGTATAAAPLTDTSGLPIHIARLLRGLRLPVVIA